MRKKTYLKILEMQTEQSAKHLEEVRSIHREMRGYKHDFHHHLQVLRTRLEAGETEKALAYIEELDRRLQQVDTLLKTGNTALDAILSGKLAQAKALGIRTTVKANAAEDLTISDVSLSIIVGNLLDNAMEACRKAEGEPFIDLYIGMKNKMLYFHMMNAAGNKKQKQGKLFGSDKRGLHGFGLGRAQTVIEENGGWCKFNSEDGAFTSEFLVPAVK